MIIRLSGADFSANNIGKIDVPQELSQDTLKILKNYTKPLTLAQQFALQDFIISLKSNNLLSKIGNLYLPILANDITETMYNVKTDIKDSVPNSEFYKIGTRGGIKSVNGLNVLAQNRISVKINASQMNHHQLFYALEDYTDISEGLSWINVINAQRKLEPTQYNTNGIVYNNTSDGNGNLVPNRSAIVAPFINPKMIGVSCGQDGYKMIGKNPSGVSVIEEAQYGSGITDTTYTNENIYILNSANIGIKNSYGLISLGIALSKDEILKYAEISNSFIMKLI